MNFVLFQALLKMSLIPRFRYILSKWHPHALAVNQILDILTLVTMHSPNAANQVLNKRVKPLFLVNAKFQNK